MVGGHVFGDEPSHCVIDEAGNWRIGVQHAPDHVPPEWPDGSPQQVHLDLHVQDAAEAHERAMALGARLLKEAPDMKAEEGHQVYADPAGTRSASGGVIRRKRQSLLSSQRDWADPRHADLRLARNLTGRYDSMGEAVE